MYGSIAWVRINDEELWLVSNIELILGMIYNFRILPIRDIPKSLVGFKASLAEIRLIQNINVF